MRYNLRNIAGNTVFLSMVAMGMLSCITAKKINYIQETAGVDTTRYSAEIPQYKVQADDNLYIKFSSLDPATAQILEPEAAWSVNSQNEYERKYKDVYKVSTKGYIDIPPVGDIYVKGLNLEEIQDTIDYSVSKYFSQINVQVRLADAYVTILGEVKKPGRYPINFDDKITVFDFLGSAGDLTGHANRSDIQLIRKNGENAEILHIDLTDSDILENEFFYLMPNDIIYVKRLSAVFWDKSSFPFFTTLSVVLSTTAAILVILTYKK
jgi:polysaccharide biosynthesis/export protein